MKFGVFLDYAKSEGFEAVATGHYARIRSNDNGTHDILCGTDPNKNQTYFLALLNQNQVAHALFAGPRRRMRVDNESFSKRKDYLAETGLVVWIGNDDIDLVRGSADSRRRYLDFGASQLSAGY